MFGENLRNIRKAAGFSQEELAQRLHVARQTISKWEKGLSVPDADMLIRIAGIFEKPVSKLLGGPIETPEDTNTVAQKLEQLNFQLAERNRRSRRIWKVIAGILIFFIVFTVAQLILSFSAYRSFDEKVTIQVLSQTEDPAE